MKKSVNIKYFLLIIFFVLNSFSVSTSIRDVNYGAIDTKESLNKDVPLVFYPEEITLKVNQKLILSSIASTKDMIFTAV